MKSLKYIVSLIISTILLLACLTAFASPVEYSSTIPSLLDKTLVSGARSTSQDWWSHKMKSSSQASSMVCWCDATIDGTWTRATSNHTVIDNDYTQTFLWDRFIPVTNASTRLRAQPSEYGGQTVVGVIDFK